MFTYANQSRSPLNIIGDGFRLFKSSFSKVWLWQLLNILAFFIPPGAVGIFMGMADQRQLGFLQALLCLVVFVVGFFMVAFSYLIVMIRMHRVAIQGDYSFAAVKRVAFRKSWSLLLLMVLFVTISFLLFRVSMFFESPTVYVVGAFLMVPWLYVLVTYSLFAPNLVIDQLSLMQTIKQGFAFIQGQWWRTAWVLLLSYLIIFVIDSISKWIWSVTIVPLLNLGVTDKDAVMLIPSLIVNFVGAMFLVAVLLAQWSDLKLRYAAKKDLQLNA